MKKETNYYETPSLEIFKEVQEKSIKIWETYDDTYGYSSKKINRVKELNNIKDNILYIVSMFDSSNKLILLNNLSKKTKKFILDRIN